MKKKLVVLTGAGISAESGIPTFRDAVDGLWENYSIEDVCTAEAIRRDPELVHNFYNELRLKYCSAVPNEAHRKLVDLEKDYDVYIITQNVDNLHEQAGSSNVLHLHGEMMKCRDVNNTEIVFDIPEDADGKKRTYPGMRIDGHEVRPHIVFFHEDVPNITKAAHLMMEADLCIVIGTSFNVYPAAGLIDYLPSGCPIYYIDPRPSISASSYPGVEVIAAVATKGMAQLADRLRN